MPLPSPPPPTLPARNRSKKPLTTVHISVFRLMPLPPPAQDWADLPLDALSCVFHKLDTIELLIGGVARVCRSWRRAAREEPSLWRRIDLRGQFVPPFQWRDSFNIMMRDTLRLSAGQCEAFFGEYLNDDTLLYIVEQAPSLKSLHLTRSYRLSQKVLVKAIKMLPLLEELELSLCLYGSELLELVAEACPQLKHFRHVKNRNDIYGTKYTDDGEAFAIAKMHELRSLHLIADFLTNKGLTAILDNCPNLEYLNIRDCPHIRMDDNLEKKCACITMDHYEYSLPRNLCGRFCSSPPNVRYFEGDGYSDDSWSVSDYLLDGIDDADIDDADIDDAESVLDNKRMLRYT